MDKSMEVFSNNIKKYLKANRLSQRDFAKMVGISDVTMSRYINGTRVPRGDVLLNMTRTMGICEDALFKNIDMETMQVNMLDDRTKDRLRLLVSESLIELSDNLSISKEENVPYSFTNTLHLVRDIVHILDNLVEVPNDNK